jgi:GxxExxY protein
MSHSDRQAASANVVFLKEEGYAIQGAIFEVYREVGSGFLEAVYQECLEEEFRKRKIPFTAQPELTINYKGQAIRHTYKPDFVCYDCIIVELKAVQSLNAQHKAQVINYLKASNFQLGILVNFCAYPKVEVHRLLNK